MGRVSNTRAVRQSSRVVEGGQPLPSAPPGRTPTRSVDPAPGALRRADPEERADDSAPRSPALSPPLRHLVCPAAVPPALVLLTEHLAAQHAALPIRRTATRRPARHLGRLPHRGEVPGDARRIFDQREQPHPPLAPGAGENIHREGARQKFRPRAVAPCVIRPARLVARGGLWGRLRRETRPPRARQGQHARVGGGCAAEVEAHWWPAGTAMTAGPCPPRWSRRCRPSSG